MTTCELRGHNLLAVVHRRARTVRLFFSMWPFLALLFLSGRALAWEQRADYEMDVHLDDSNRSVHVDATLLYVNHSPDTLATLWFRLSPEATRGDAPLQQVEFRGAKYRLRNVPGEDWGGLTVSRIEAAGRDLDWRPDGSIASAELDHPLLPGDSVRIEMSFTTKFPDHGARARIGYQEGQYKGSYWYPMICPYTERAGWTVNRYYGTAEAYGEFGTFRVRYHVPYRFIVASTGELVNEVEVLPPERLAGLGFDANPPLPIPTDAEGDRVVVWEYLAETVPDVAFAMAPNFLIQRKDFGHFEAWAFVRRGREMKWPDACDILGYTIQQLESIYGPYPWPRVMMTDSRSGMEYPMLTMMSTDSRYQYFLMHEVIHNYTPMILHSSSVDAQVLDEGFTTFVEHTLARRYAGSDWDKPTTVDRGPFRDTLMLRDDWERGLRPYYAAVLAGEDLPMVLGGDIAEDYPLLRVSSYYKTPVMLNALRYVVGEEAFWAGMREYYNRGALRHVDETDVIAAFSKAADTPLVWFFHQFLFDSGDIDYSVDLKRVHREGQRWRVEFTVGRPGEVRLPLRLAVVTESGDTLRGEIPFLPSDRNWSGHERWGSWDQLHEPDDERKFSVLLASDSKPVGITLDERQLLADRNPLNDSDPGPVHSFRMEWGLFPQEPPPMDRVEWRFSPAVGYSDASGALYGVNFRSSWNDYLDLIQTQLFYAPNSANAAVLGRMGFSQPLGRGFGPFHLEGQGGSLHDQRFGELGVAGTWRRWRPDRTRFTARLTLDRYEDGWIDGGVHTASWIAGHLLSETSYHGFTLNTALRIVGALESEGYFSSEYTVALHTKGSQWKFTPVGKLLKHFSFDAESRLGWQGGALPRPLRLSLQSVMPMTVLGSPLFGGQWESYPATRPIADGPATTALSTFSEPSRFGVAKLRMGWSPRLLLPKITNTIFSRALAKTRLAVYQAIAGTHSGGIAGDFGDLRWHMESGVELQFLDWYGVTLTARLPLAQGYSITGDGSTWRSAGDIVNNFVEDEIVVGVRIDSGVFVGRRGL